MGKPYYTIKLISMMATNHFLSMPLTHDAEPFDIDRSQLMEIHILRKKEEVNTLENDTKFIHIAFRPSNADFLNILDRAPNVKVIQITPSYEKSISVVSRVVLKHHKIEITSGILPHNNIVKMIGEKK